MMIGLTRDGTMEEPVQRRGEILRCERGHVFCFPPVQLTTNRTDHAQLTSTLLELVNTVYCLGVLGSQCYTRPRY